MIYPGLFNGINFDWEYLSNDGKNYGNVDNEADPKDPDNFIELLKLIRQKFGNTLRISIAVVAAPEKIKMPVDRIHPLV
jgi:GH18 family chitinase